MWQASIFKLGAGFWGPRCRILRCKRHRTKILFICTPVTQTPLNTYINHSFAIINNLISAFGGC